MTNIPKERLRVQNIVRSLPSRWVFSEELLKYSYSAVKHFPGSLYISVTYSHPFSFKCLTHSWDFRSQDYFGFPWVSVSFLWICGELLIYPLNDCLQCTSYPYCWLCASDQTNKHIYLPRMLKWQFKFCLPYCLWITFIPGQRPAQSRSTTSVLFEC